MTQLTFDQFVHPLSEFPSIVQSEGNDEPMLDLYTMAGVVLYTACANNNTKARESILQTLTTHPELDGDVLFDRCHMGDRAAILQMITLIVSGLESSLEALTVV